MKINQFAFIIAAICFQFAFAQSGGSIQGKIINSYGNEIENATVQILGTTMGTETDASGDFYLSNIPTGNYTLNISFVGYKTSEVVVSVTAGRTTTVPNIVLTQNEEELGEVLLRTEANPNTFTRNASVFVSKLPLKDIENPQVVSNITNELLQQQIVVNFDDALKNAPGITKLWESTGRGNDGAGYFSLRGFPVQPTLTNGLPALTNGSPDPANIENIEIMKGPSGTLYGGNVISYGGLINIVTKRPYNYFGGNVSYIAGSYGLNRVTADVNTPLDETGDVALRINTAYETQNSFQDAGFNKSFFIAPSLSYKINDRLSFFVNTEFYNAKGTNPTMLFLDRGAPLRVTNIDELGFNNERSYTSNDLTLETPSYSLQGQMNYKLSDSWTSQTAISRGSASARGHYSYLYETTQYYDISEGVVFTRYMNDQNSTTLTTDIQQNFVGDFEIAGMRNRMVVGLDYFNRNVIDNNSGYVGNGNIYIGNASAAEVNENVFGITDPSMYINNNDSGILSTAAVNNLLANTARNSAQTEEEIYSAYISNVLNIIPTLSVMASLRVDQFENVTNSQTALSPKFGIVYQPIEDRLSLFANYMDGFSNVDPIATLDPTTGETQTLIFEPENARQFEFGTKVNFLNNRISGSLSYYDISVSNIVLDAFGPQPVQGGEQYSRGIEAQISASPINGLNLIAGYSYNDSEVIRGDADFDGLRPESAGPQNLANLWASYKFSSSNLNGFGLGFGGNYASENMIFNRNVAGQFTLPSYTVLDASIFYDVEKFAINLKLNNLTNKEYYTGWSTINPQMQRNIIASFTYNF